MQSQNLSSIFNILLVHIKDASPFPNMATERFTMRRLPFTSDKTQNDARPAATLTEAVCLRRGCQSYMSKNQ